MKNKQTLLLKTTKLVLIISMLLLLLPGAAWAGSTASYTVAVGKTQSLEFNDRGRVIHSAMWYSNSPAVEIVSSGVNSCLIQVNSYSPVLVIVRCDYYY